jgi:hypothetical protein
MFSVGGSIVVAFVVRVDADILLMLVGLVLFNLEGLGVVSYC